MSRQDFSTSEFADRLARVRAEVARRDLDWLVAIHPASLHWLIGSEAKSYQEFQCLLVGGDGQPLTALVRQGEVAELEVESLADEVVGWGGGFAEDPIEVVARLARRHGLVGKHIGLEVPASYLHPYHLLALQQLFGVERVVDATTLIADLKLAKSPAELGYIRHAAGLADQAMARFARELAPGKTELALAGGIYHALLTAGSDIAASPINLVSGPRSAFSHGAPTGRMLKNGDFGNVEYGASFRRYSATLGRQFVLGRPTPRMLELYDVVRAAADAMLAVMRPGLPAVEAHAAACAVIDAAGMTPYRVHLSGYGLGPGFPPSWAEPLHLIDGSRYVLEAGMVLTVEPPVFIGPERLGARLIDNVLITEGGAELLSGFSRELIIVD
jgi:Xaa-Pro dipeptidase